MRKRGRLGHPFLLFLDLESLNLLKLGDLRLGGRTLDFGGKVRDLPPDLAQGRRGLPGQFLRSPREAYRDRRPPPRRDLLLDLSRASTEASRRRPGLGDGPRLPPGVQTLRFDPKHGRPRSRPDLRFGA